MDANAVAPIIIKRKKVIAGGGHHGGAWKVAYADFVTAMMAFFLLMWLLNATTEQQRKGVADFFSPTVPINRISGGGDGAFGGDNIFTEQTLAKNGTGASQVTSGDANYQSSESETRAEDAERARVAALREVERELLGRGGESMLSEQALRHVITRLTDEGLIIEIFDLPDAPLFEAESAIPTQTTIELTQMFARVFEIVENRVAINGHTKSAPIVLVDNPVWDLSTDRAGIVRNLLEAGGLEPGRLARIAGHADRKLSVINPFAVRNNRIEIILLRTEF